MEEREEVGVGDAREILQNIACFLGIGIRQSDFTQIYSPVPLYENEDFRKDSGKKGES